MGHRLDTWGVGNDAAHICLAIVHVLDDQEGIVDVRGFGEGLLESIVCLMAVDYLENMLDSMVRINGGGAKPSAACT
jgi:hypothetical protein